MTNSKQRPALFSPEAGFLQARHTHTNPVEPITVARRQWLVHAMRYWNSLAGWKLFVYGLDPTDIRLRFDPQRRYAAFAYSREGDWWYEGGSNWPDWNSPYLLCEISMARDGRSNLVTVAHELGHCLGLRHQTKGVMHPTTNKTNRRFDRRLLAKAGYRG